MTKSEMEWEDCFSHEKACNIARRFAIEDAALKYRTSLATAEKIVANGTIVNDMPTRTENAKSLDVIHVDDSDSQEEMEEDLLQDVVDSRHSMQPQRQPNRLGLTKPPLFQASQAQKLFVSPAATKPTTPGTPCYRRTYPTPTLAGGYPNTTGSFSHSYPFLYTTAGINNTQSRYAPFQVNRNRGLSKETSDAVRKQESPQCPGLFEEILEEFVYREQTSENKPPEEKLRTYAIQEKRSQLVGLVQEEKLRIFGPTEARSVTFKSQEEGPRTFALTEAKYSTFEPQGERFGNIRRAGESPRIIEWRNEKPRTYAISGKRYQLFESQQEISRNPSQFSKEISDAFVNKNMRFFNEAVFKSDGEQSRVNEGRPRSHTIPGARSNIETVPPKHDAIKQRPHSDEEVTNSNRPSVIVMRRSLSNPLKYCNEHKVGLSSEPCTSTGATDSDSSATPPLTQEGSSSNSDSNKEEKPHKCTICHRGFRKNSALVIHYRVHSGEKPYRCPKCSRKFSISGNLRRHFLIHTGERPYVCPQCSRAFNNPSHLTRHRRKLHKTGLNNSTEKQS